MDQRLWAKIEEPADGSGEASPLVSTPADEEMANWSRDQRFLIYEGRVARNEE